VGDIVGVAHMAHRDVTANRGLLLRGGEGPPAWLDDETRLDAIEGDAVAREFEGGAADEGVDPRLGRLIVRTAGHRHARRNGRGDKQPAETAAPHMRHCRLNQPDEGVEVDVHRLAKLRLVNLLDRGPRATAGIVHGDIEPARFRRQPVDHFAHLRAAGARPADRAG